MTTADERAKVGLPTRPFLYTIDQLSVLLELGERTLATGYLYFEGRSTGTHSLDLMLARNVAPPNEKPEWRVAERELIRWLKRKGFILYDRTWVRK